MISSNKLLRDIDSKTTSCFDLHKKPEETKKTPKLADLLNQVYDLASYRASSIRQIIGHPHAELPIINVFPIFGTNYK